MSSCDGVSPIQKGACPELRDRVPPRRCSSQPCNFPREFAMLTPLIRRLRLPACGRTKTSVLHINELTVRQFRCHPRGTPLKTDADNARMLTTHRSFNPHVRACRELGARSMKKNSRASSHGRSGTVAAGREQARQSALLQA